MSPGAARTCPKGPQCATIVVGLAISFVLPGAVTPPPAKKAAASKAKGKAKTRTVRASGPARQNTPDSNRYREIQQALLDKGYLKTAPSGVWDADSTEAMRKFQADQKLEPTGKLTAKSLIGLGLGPKESSPVAAAAPTPEAPKPQ